LGAIAAVAVVIESGRPIAHVARDIALPPETLHKRVRQAEADGGLRPDLPTGEEREEIKKLRKEVFELRRANEILKAGVSNWWTDRDSHWEPRRRNIHRRGLLH
jgi:transposase